MRTTALRRLVGATLAVAAVLAGPAFGEPASPAVNRYTKIMVITEENRTYDEIIGSPEAPFLTRVARTHGTAARMVANYPVHCPSLAGYLLMTSGTTAGICDDRGPDHHRLAVPNIFAQLDAAHRPWRNYAEHLPSTCARKNSSDGVFLVRHTAVPYYTSEARTCRIGQVELGSPARGALRDDVAAGRLPAYSFVTPDACHDMHGAPGCATRRIVRGDAWLAGWLPRIMAGPDYRAGRLIIIVTWDEGSIKDNHIPTLVISPSTRGVRSARPYDHCSTLRTTEDVLRLPLLGCARTATALTDDFNLRN